MHPTVQFISLSGCRTRRRRLRTELDLLLLVLGTADAIYSQKDDYKKAQLTQRERARAVYV